MRAPRVHHAARRHGGGVAARGAGAAAGDASGRVSVRRFAGGERPSAFSKGLSEMGLSTAETWRSSTVGRKAKRSTAGDRGRVWFARQVAVISRRRRDLSVVAAKSATTTIPIIFVMGDDPVEAGSRCQPQPAGWQRHRDELHERTAYCEADRIIARAHAGSRTLCHARQSGNRALPQRRQRRAGGAAAIGRSD